MYVQALPLFRIQTSLEQAVRGLEMKQNPDFSRSELTQYLDTHCAGYV